MSSATFETSLRSLGPAAHSGRPWKFVLTLRFPFLQGSYHESFQLRLSCHASPNLYIIQSWSSPQPSQRSLVHQWPDNELNISDHWKSELMSGLRVYYFVTCFSRCLLHAHRSQSLRCHSASLEYVLKWYETNTTNFTISMIIRLQVGKSGVVGHKLSMTIRSPKNSRPTRALLPQLRPIYSRPKIIHTVGFRHPEASGRTSGRPTTDSIHL